MLCVDFDTVFSRSKKPNVGSNEIVEEMGLPGGSFTLNTEEVNLTILPSFKLRSRTDHRPTQH